MIYTIQDVRNLVKKGFSFHDPIDLFYMMKQANETLEYEIRINRSRKTFVFRKIGEELEEGDEVYNPAEFEEKELD